MGARFREDPEWPRAFRATVAANERRGKLYGVCHRASPQTPHALMICHAEQSSIEGPYIPIRTRFSITNCVSLFTWPGPFLFCQRLCRALSPQLRLKLGDMWDLSYPTKRLSYPVPLSCPLRVYISVAPQLTPTYPLESIYPLGSTWASCQVPPPVTLHISPLGHGAGWRRVPRWVF